MLYGLTGTGRPIRRRWELLPRFLDKVGCWIRFIRSVNSGSGICYLIITSRPSWESPDDVYRCPAWIVLPVLSVTLLLRNDVSYVLWLSISCEKSIGAVVPNIIMRDKVHPDHVRKERRNRARFCVSGMAWP